MLAIIILTGVCLLMYVDVLIATRKVDALLKEFA